MLTEILLGTALMFVTMSIGALGAWGLEVAMDRAHYWLIREPHRPKLFAVVLGATLGSLLIITTAVWTWALTFYALGIFHTLEPAVYFSLVTFTTIGYGDVVLPVGWRILGGMAAANGLILFGLLTALMVDALRQLHKTQRASRMPPYHYH